MDRLGLGEVLTRKGITWQTGKVFFAARRLFEFDLLSGTRRGSLVWAFMAIVAKSTSAALMQINPVPRLQPKT